MNEFMVPIMQEHEAQQGGNMHRNVFDTERKLHISESDTFSEEAATPSIQVQDISIQAAPILQDYSRIDFYDDRDMSSLSIF